MQGPEHATPPPTASFESTGDPAVTSGPMLVASRAADTIWTVLHALGAHRWRDGYETDLVRGWSRYRGSRCTICDAPWEGW